MNPVPDSSASGFVEVRRTDVCALSMVRRVAAMLDLDPDGITAGQPLRHGWHFFLLGGDTRKSALRSDGFPGFGLPMPDMGLPRLLLGGRTVTYNSDILIGSEIERTSQIVRLDRKEGASGPSAIITLRHELRMISSSAAAITETQTYILLPQAKAAPPVSKEAHPFKGAKTVTPDETLLFMYSALGFNTHKIHLDRDHARTIEGLPDLVVNGGLVTLLATEYLRTELGIVPGSLKTRHTAPLYCGRPIHFDVEHKGGIIALIATDDAGVAAMDMQVETA